MSVPGQFTIKVLSSLDSHTFNKLDTKYLEARDFVIRESFTVSGQIIRST